MELVVASKTFRMAVCFINTSVGMSYSLGASSAPRTVWQDFREIERSCCGLRRGLISTRAASRSMGEEPGERRRGSLADVFPGKPILSRLSPTQGTGGIFLARKDLGARAAAGHRCWAGCVGELSPGCCGRLQLRRVRGAWRGIPVSQPGRELPPVIHFAEFDLL